MNETAPKPLARLNLSLLLAACAVACSPAAGAGEAPLRGARIGGPFTLTDQDGRTVSDRAFAGKYRLVYFGYTHCPDICPNDLGVIGQAMRRFEKEAPSKAAKVQPIFITVDPERDTPAVMREYAAAFHPRLIGLTGTPAQIAAVTKEYAVWSGKQPPQPGGGYAVDHSRMSVLMGPEGQPIALLPSDQGAAEVLAELRKWVT
jgi:protein SCO1/2